MVQCKFYKVIVWKQSFFLIHSGNLHIYHSVFIFKVYCHFKTTVFLSPFSIIICFVKTADLSKDSQNL